jgi:hypothetical protein
VLRGVLLGSARHAGGSCRGVRLAGRFMGLVRHGLRHDIWAWRLLFRKTFRTSLHGPRQRCLPPASIPPLFFIAGSLALASRGRSSSWLEICASLLLDRCRSSWPPFRYVAHCGPAVDPILHPGQLTISLPAVQTDQTTRSDCTPCSPSLACAGVPFPAPVLREKDRFSCVRTTTLPDND